MYGAVLWCDPSCERALIWCEDHADLAFFAAEQAGATQIEAGDLVSFTLTKKKTLRMAQDLEVVATEEYPFLADELQQAMDPKSQASGFVADCAPRSNVVPFILPDRPARRVPQVSARKSQAR